MLFQRELGTVVDDDDDEMASVTSASLETTFRDEACRARITASICHL